MRRSLQMLVLSTIPKGPFLTKKRISSFHASAKGPRFSGMYFSGTPLCLVTVSLAWRFSAIRVGSKCNLFTRRLIDIGPDVRGSKHPPFVIYRNYDCLAFCVNDFERPFPPFPFCTDDQHWASYWESTQPQGVFNTLWSLCVPKTKCYFSASLLFYYILHCDFNYLSLIHLQ